MQKEPFREKASPKNLSHKQIMKLIPADVCRGCALRSLVCKKQWVSHPSFRCNGINVIQTILETSRNE
jgi:hypothetical protein